MGSCPSLIRVEPKLLHRPDPQGPCGLLHPAIEAGQLGATAVPCSMAYLRTDTVMALLESQGAVGQRHQRSPPRQSSITEGVSGMVA